jgi:16S rRNA (cytosine967-C5)-methyltransferase
VNFILIQRAAELVAQLVDETSAPADRRIERYFKTHRNMGGRDRAFVAETAYGVLRRRRSLAVLLGETFPGGGFSAEDLVIAYLVTAQGWTAHSLRAAGVGERGGAIVQSASCAHPELWPAAVLSDMPDWLWTGLCDQLGPTEARAVCAALNEQASLDLRVNTLKTTREELLQRLYQEGVAAAPTPFSPVGLRCVERTPLFGLTSFREGLFEVQDEGSQLVTLLVEAKRRERVVDFCAGSGGKTLHLAAAMANTGTIYAFDIAAKRLDPIRARLARAGVDNVRTVLIRNENDAHVRRLDGKIDRVLIDAPCSGTGTLRRNPDIKWRPISLKELTRVQSAILRSASRLLRPGGRLVYATCSLLHEEGEDIIADFILQTDRFRIVPINEMLARRQVNITEASTADGFLRLSPHRHETDGFFAAVLDVEPR